MDKNSSIPKVIVVLGPTASGKSELAVKIAEKFGGEIISADSRQVYKGLDIGSGKVPLSKCQTCDKCRDREKCHICKKGELCYKNIPHYLIDVASPKQIFTAARYQKLALKALRDIIKRGKLPILCGGTGFYIDALIHGLKFPAVAPQPKLRKNLENKSTEELFYRLKKLDPERAKNIDKNNRRRLIRALEIVVTTGKPVPPAAAEIAADFGKLSTFKIGVRKDPEKLKKSIKKRLAVRLRQGMIDEVKNLKRRGLPWKRLDDLGLEYRYLSRYLRGLITEKEMINSIQKETEKYAKRQLTWFNKDKEIVWTAKPGKVLKLVKNFLKNEN